MEQAAPHPQIHFQHIHRIEPHKRASGNASATIFIEKIDCEKKAQIPNWYRYQAILWNRLLEHLHVCPATKHSSLSMLLSPSSQRQNALWGVNEACENLFQDTKCLSSYNRFQWQWFSHHLRRDKSIVKRRPQIPNWRGNQTRLWNRLLEHLHDCPATKHYPLLMLQSPSSQREKWVVRRSDLKAYHIIYWEVI